MAEGPEQPKKLIDLSLLDPLSEHKQDYPSLPIALEFPRSLVERNGDITVLCGNSLYEFKLAAPNNISLLLEDVKAVYGNRYCTVVLSTRGEVLVRGKDPVETGILGLGKGIAQTIVFKAINIPVRVKTLSIAETYGVAVGTNDEIFVWGTTPNNFLSEEISNTHFIPTQLEFSHIFSVEAIFCHPETLFLASIDNSIECFTKIASAGSLKNSSSKVAERKTGFRIPSFCNSPFIHISQFSRFTVFLTSSHELYLYDPHSLSISHEQPKVAFTTVSTTKNRLLAYSQSTHSLHIYFSDLYSSSPLVYLQRIIVSMEGYGLVQVGQMNSDNKIVVMAFGGCEDGQSRKMVFLGKDKKGAKNSALELTEDKKELVFEKSYIRMKYLELKNKHKRTNSRGHTGGLLSMGSTQQGNAWLSMQTQDKKFATLSAGIADSELHDFNHNHDPYKMPKQTAYHNAHFEEEYDSSSYHRPNTRDNKSQNTPDSYFHSEHHNTNKDNLYHSDYYHSSRRKDKGEEGEQIVEGCRGVGVERDGHGEVQGGDPMGRTGESWNPALTLRTTGGGWASIGTMTEEKERFIPSRLPKAVQATSRNESLKASKSVAIETDPIEIERNTDNVVIGSVDHKLIQNNFSQQFSQQNEVDYKYKTETNLQASIALNEAIAIENPARIIEEVESSEMINLKYPRNTEQSKASLSLALQHSQASSLERQSNVLSSVELKIPSNLERRSKEDYNNFKDEKIDTRVEHKTGNIQHRKPSIGDGRVTTSALNSPHSPIVISIPASPSPSPIFITHEQKSNPANQPQTSVAQPGAKEHDFFKFDKRKRQKTNQQAVFQPNTNFSKDPSTPAYLPAATLAKQNNHQEPAPSPSPSLHNTSLPENTLSPALPEFLSPAGISKQESGSILALWHRLHGNEGRNLAASPSLVSSAMSNIAALQNDSSKQAAHNLNTANMDNSAELISQQKMLEHNIFVKSFEQSSHANSKVQIRDLGNAFSESPRENQPDQISAKQKDTKQCTVELSWGVTPPGMSQMKQESGRQQSLEKLNQETQRKKSLKKLITNMNTEGRVNPSKYISQIDTYRLSDSPAKSIAQPLMKRMSEFMSPDPSIQTSEPLLEQPEDHIGGITSSHRSTFRPDKLYLGDSPEEKEKLYELGPNGYKKSNNTTPTKPISFKKGPLPCDQGSEKLLRPSPETKHVLTSSLNNNENQLLKTSPFNQSQEAAAHLEHFVNLTIPGISANPSASSLVQDVEQEQKKVTPARPVHYTTRPKSPLRLLTSPLTFPLYPLQDNLKPILESERDKIHAPLTASDIQQSASSSVIFKKSLHRLKSLCNRDKSTKSAKSHKPSKSHNNSQSKDLSTCNVNVSASRLIKQTVRESSFYHPPCIDDSIGGQGKRGGRERIKGSGKGRGREDGRGEGGKRRRSDVGTVSAVDIDSMLDQIKQELQLDTKKNDLILHENMDMVVPLPPANSSLPDSGKTQNLPPPQPAPTTPPGPLPTIPSLSALLPQIPLSRLSTSTHSLINSKNGLHFYEWKDLTNSRLYTRGGYRLTIIA
jgi:hypothetical protein